MTQAHLSNYQDLKKNKNILTDKPINCIFMFPVHKIHVREHRRDNPEKLAIYGTQDEDNPEKLAIYSTQDEEKQT